MREQHARTVENILSQARLPGREWTKAPYEQAYSTTVEGVGELHVGFGQTEGWGPMHHYAGIRAERPVAHEVQSMLDRRAKELFEIADRESRHLR